MPAGASGLMLASNWVDNNERSSMGAHGEVVEFFSGSGRAAAVSFIFSYNAWRLRGMDMHLENKKQNVK